MKHVARILHIDDVTGERCVACGDPAEKSVDLETPAGVLVPAERRVTAARVCRRCWEEQSAAMRPEGRLFTVALAAMPPLLGLATGALVGRPDGIATTAAVVLAHVVVHRVRTALRRARAKRTPVLLLEAGGDRVVLQLLVHEARVVSADGYRAPANAAEDYDEEVAPLPPATRWSPAWTVGMFVSSLVVLLGSSGGFARRASTILVDSPTRPVRVAIDGAPFEIAAGSRLAHTVEPGRHRFDVTYLDTNETVHGDLEVRAASGVLLSTDERQCYAFWESGFGKTKRHDHGAAYWFELTMPERGFERASCERAPMRAPNPFEARGFADTDDIDAPRAPIPTGPCVGSGDELALDAEVLKMLDRRPTAARDRLDAKASRADAGTCVRLVYALSRWSAEKIKSPFAQWLREDRRFLSDNNLADALFHLTERAVESGAGDVGASFYAAWIGSKPVGASLTPVERKRVLVLVAGLGDLVDPGDVRRQVVEATLDHDPEFVELARRFGGGLNGEDVVDFLRKRRASKPTPSWIGAFARDLPSYTTLGELEDREASERIARAMTELGDVPPAVARQQLADALASLRAKP